MPKRTSGGPKAPVRALTSLLRELDGNTQNQISSAFADAEQLLDFHSRSVPERQRRRKISGYVKQIVLTGESNLLGGFVKWERLDDPRISFYELQISDDNIFSNPETLTSLDTFVSLENIRTVKFIRVRGVQANNGDTGLWSNTVRINPRTSAPTVNSISFYQRYVGGAEPRIQKKLRYSPGSAHGLPEFYTVMSQDFYVNRLFGGLSAWGYISSRLSRYMDGGFNVWDRVRFKVNGLTRMDGYFPHWVNVAFPDPIRFNFHDFSPTGQKMTFYMQGGYTASFGPYAVSVPNTLSGFGPNDPHSVVNMDTLDGAFYWNDPMNARKASRFDEAQLRGFNDTIPAHEAHSDQINENGITDWLIFRDYRFDVPDNQTVVGIQAQIKRRQANIFNDEISANFGVKRPDLADGFLTNPPGHEGDDEFGLPDNFVLEHRATVVGPGTPTNAESSNILEDVDFGRFLDLTCNLGGNNGRLSGRLSMDLTGIGDDGLLRGHHTVPQNFIQCPIWTNNEFTMAAWIRSPTPSNYHTGTNTQRIIECSAFNVTPNIPPITFGSLIADISIRLNTNATTNTITNFTSGFSYSGTGVGATNNLNCSFNTTPATSTINAWHHVAVTWSRTGIGPNDDGFHKLYIDGVLRTTAVGGGTWLGRRWGPFHFGVAIGTVAQGTTGAGQGQSILSMAHVGMWDVALTPKEIEVLYESKGRVDYRRNFNGYNSASQLNHYFLCFPDRSDIRDFQVCLVDDTGVRTDLDDKAIDTESWPQLGQFFYTNIRQYGVLPLAVSDGIPHDNHTAIGYQEYGGETDLWGGTWSPAQVNDFYFGVALRATNEILRGWRGDAFVDHAKLTVFTAPRVDRAVNVKVEVAAANQFYVEREIFGGIMNLIELGEKFPDA